MSEAALVGRCRARRLRQDERLTGPTQIQIRNHRLLRRTDWRHNNRLPPVPRQLPEDVRRFGRGKSDNRVRPKNWAAHRSCGLVRRPAGRQINRENWRVPHPRDVFVFVASILSLKFVHKMHVILSGV